MTTAEYIKLNVDEKMFDYKSLIMSVVSPVMIDPCPSPLLLRIIRSIYHVIKNNENTNKNS